MNSFSALEDDVHILCLQVNYLESAWRVLETFINVASVSLFTHYHLWRNYLIAYNLMVK